MSLKGNKGEWSEIYALIRMLGEGKIHAGDEFLNKLDLFYPIVNIIREENARYEYKPKIEKNIVVIDENGKEYASLPMSTFVTHSKFLLHSIKEASGRSFAIPETESFMSKIGCGMLKAPSKDKADIHVVLHDLHTGMNHFHGFSIKSQLGGNATLLNAGHATNITYRLTGRRLSDNEIVEINGVDSHLKRMKSIFDKGCRLEYSDIKHRTFKNNLLFLDYCMPAFVAYCLLCDNMPNPTSSIKSAVEKVALQNPFGYNGANIESFYEHKMKVLLVDTALGMTASKEWNGRYDADGGYIVVRNDGEIICYHFYKKNNVEDYLYNNTRFERASRGRHKYGSLYREQDGNVYIDLNLQIRFIE